MNIPPNAERLIPLAQRVFAKRVESKPLLVIQHATDMVTGQKYFRFVSPSGVEGYAPDAESAEPRILEIAAKLGLEIYDEIIPISV